jgi:sugar O-acyltransferase (sialic acid O-acetyltransferase NeuD family)
VISGIGIPKTRQLTMEKAVSNGFDTEIIIHPRVEHSSWVKIDKGALICAGCIITTNIEIGKHVQINLDCTIGHDVIIGDYTTISPGVHISGFVHIGERVFVGTGAVFINGNEGNPLRIGNDVVIGAGACVTKSIQSGMWGGVPASPLKK